MSDDAQILFPPSREGTHSSKWDRYQEQDVLPMWVADADYQTAPCVLEALRGRLDHGVLGYTEIPAPLTRRTLDWMAARSLRAEPDWLVWVPGLVPALYLCVRALTAPGESVLCPSPVYPPLFRCVERSDRRLLSVPMDDAATRPLLTPQALAQAVQPDTRLLIFCNPHNPGGTVYTRAELQALLDFCSQRGIAVLSDEVHCDLILEEGLEHTHMAALDGGEAVITMAAATKTYNMAGLNCAVLAIADPALRARVAQAKRGIMPDPGVDGLLATMAAWSDAAKPWHLALLRHLREQRGLVAQALADYPALGYASPQATFLAWMDMRPLGLEQSPRAYFEGFGLGLSDGSEFGTPGFARLNFATDADRLRTGLERLRRGLDRALS